MALNGASCRTQSDMTQNIRQHSQNRVQMESYGKLKFLIQALVYPSTACALTNWSMNLMFLIECLHTNSD